MKKLFALALLAFSALAHAGANDIVFTLRNGGDNGQGPVVPSHPTSGVGIIAYDSSTLLPVYLTQGTCLTISSGVLALTTACTPVNADWNASSGLAQILNKPTIPAAQVNSDWAAGSGLAQILNRPSTFTPSAHTHAASDIVSGTLDVARIPTLAISNTTGLQAALDAKFATPAGTTAQYVRGDGSLATLPSVAARSFSYTTRALNTCFQPSATRDVLATYSVDIATTLSLTAGQQGTVYLRTYSNSGCSAGTQEVTRFVNGQTGALTIGLALTQNVTGTLTGVIPAGAYVQLVTENNTGTPTFTARPGQETQL